FHPDQLVVAVRALQYSLLLSDVGSGRLVSCSMHELDCNKMKTEIHDLRFATTWMCCNFQAQKRITHWRPKLRQPVFPLYRPGGSSPSKCGSNPTSWALCWCIALRSRGILAIVGGWLPR